MYASRHCRFISGNRPWRRSRKCCCISIAEEERRERKLNLNPNSRYIEVGSNVLRTCAAGAKPTERQRRHQKRVSPFGIITLYSSKEFAQILYRAWQHQTRRGFSVQTDLAHGKRYSFSKRTQKRDLLLESPETTLTFRTPRTNVEVLESLLLAIESGTCKQRYVLREQIAYRWLGQEKAERALKQLSD